MPADIAQETSQATADRAREALWRHDHASQALGIRLIEVGPGYCRAEMVVRQDMLNGFAIIHGGLLTTFADTAMAFASNSHGEMAVATSLGMDFVASAREGETLTTEAREISRTRRTGLYDATITAGDGRLIAVMRGRVQRLVGKPVGDA